MREEGENEGALRAPEEGAADQAQQRAECVESEPKAPEDKAPE